jgi:hypothetical protein
VRFDFTAQHAGGWPNDLGHYARAVLTGAHEAMSADRRSTAHRRSLMVPRPKSLS